MDNVRRINYFIVIIFLIVTAYSCAATSGQGMANVSGSGTYERRTAADKRHISSFPDEGDNKGSSGGDGNSLGSNTVITDSETLGDTYCRQGLYYKAFSEYEKALKEDPHNKVLIYKKGLVLFNGKLYEDAVNTFKEVINIDPNHALSLLMIGQAYFYLEDYYSAEGYLKQASSIDPTLWKAYNLMGVIHDYRNEYREAIEDYTMSIARSPDNGLLYHNLGLAYFMSGQYEKAVRSYNQAISSNYITIKTYNNMALALVKTGRYDEAFDAFVKGGRRASAYNNMGCIFMEEGDFKRAIFYFEMALEASPTYYALADENLKKAKRMMRQ